MKEKVNLRLPKLQSSTAAANVRFAVPGKEEPTLTNPERQQPRREAVQQNSSKTAEGRLTASILLSVQNGVLMAFGPEGDPVPPRLLNELCTDIDGCRLQLKEGLDVDNHRALAVFEAQQRGPLADRENNRWVESFLGHDGHFEPTPQHLLDEEPDDELPPQPPTVGMS